MADQKISELSAVVNADLATDDILPVVDTSAVETKSVSVGELDKRYGCDVRSVASTVTLDVDDSVLLADTSVAGFTVNLPAASSVSGRCYKIVKSESATDFNKCTISDGGSFSEFILGAGESVCVVSDGSAWLIVEWTESVEMSFTPSMSGATNLVDNEMLIRFCRKRAKAQHRLSFNGSGGAGTPIVVDLPTTFSLDTSRLPGSLSSGNDANALGPFSQWFENGVAWRFVSPIYNGTTTGYGMAMTTQKLFLSQLSSGDSVEYTIDIPVA